MDENIKVKFEIIQGDKTFRIGDYVEIIPKDMEKDEPCGGHINSKSNTEFLVLDDDLMFVNEIPYWDIAEIRHI